MPGQIVTRIESNVDNTPDIVAAIDLNDHTDGKAVTLEEKPHNLIEMKPSKGKSSPFLLRIIHLRQNSIPDNIKASSNFFIKNSNIIMTEIYIISYLSIIREGPILFSSLD